MNEEIRKIMLEAGYAEPIMAKRAHKLVELIILECSKIAMTHHQSHSPKDYENLEQYDKGCDDTASAISGQILSKFKA